MKPKKPGEACELSGQYCCLYHLKNKIKIRKGVPFGNCNFAGVQCEGLWYLLKEIKDKSFEKNKAERDRRRAQLDRSKERRDSLYQQYHRYDFRHRDNEEW